MRPNTIFGCRVGDEVNEYRDKYGITIGEWSDLSFQIGAEAACCEPRPPLGPREQLPGAASALNRLKTLNHQTVYTDLFT